MGWSAPSPYFQSGTGCGGEGGGQGPCLPLFFELQQEKINGRARFAGGRDVFSKKGLSANSLLTENMDG
jgi:hypothetical protein